jgi:flagellin-like hook-associated protein FlgL
MALNDISLTAGMRSNLVNLQDTVTLLNRTQGRLASGKKVNTALDNPISFFTAQAHMSRASSISALKDGMNESVQVIKAADSGIKGVSSLLEAARTLAQSAKQAASNYVKVSVGTISAGTVITIGGTAYTATAAGVTAASTEFNIGTDAASTASNLAALINTAAETTDMQANVTGSMITLSAKSASVALTSATATVSAGSGFTADTTVTAPRNDLAKQYNTVITQLDALANTSGYKGTNLLQSNNLNVGFEGTTLTVQGFDASASGLGASLTATKTSGGASNLAWCLASDIDADLAKLETATNKLNTESAKLSSSLSIINIRQDFSTNMINTLTEGADKLTLADMNEEGANMLMLQTRQSLGTTSLSLASQAAQAVLRLF